MNSNNRLSIEKQNEFAFKGKMMLEIERNLLIYVNDINLTDENKKRDYKVQLIYNASELENYCKLLKPYQENENVKTFFDGYNNIKNNMDDAVKLHSTKEILKEVKKFRQKVEELAEETAIKQAINEIKEGYGLETDDIKLVNVIKKKTKVPFLSQMLLGLVMQIILLISFSGLINYCTYNKNFFSLVLFVLYFSGIEFLLKLIISLFFKKLLFKTMGLIMLIPFIVAVVITLIFPIFITFESRLLFVIVAVLAYAIRKFMCSYIFEKLSKIKRHKKGEEDAR